MMEIKRANLDNHVDQVVKANVVTLEKKQLEKVVGGTDEASAERWQKSGIGHTIVS